MYVGAAVYGVTQSQTRLKQFSSSSILINIKFNVLVTDNQKVCLELQLLLF